MPGLRKQLLQEYVNILMSSTGTLGSLLRGKSPNETEIEQSGRDVNLEQLLPFVQLLVGDLPPFPPSGVFLRKSRIRAKTFQS